MVDHARAPGLLDALARRRDAAARLARHDQHAHRALAQRDALGRRDLGEVQRVGRRAADDGRADAREQRQPQRARHAAARHAERADLRAGVEGRPEAEEGPERERKEDAVARAHARRRGRPPSSTRAATASSRWCRSSAAAGRWSTRSGSSACSASSGSRERRAPGRVRGLVGDELGLGRERQPLEVAREAQRSRAHARRLELARVEGVAPWSRSRSAGEPLALQRAERVALERLLRRQARRDAHGRSAALRGRRSHRPAPPRSARGSRAGSARRAHRLVGRAAWRRRSSRGRSRSWCRRASARRCRRSSAPRSPRCGSRPRTPPRSAAGGGSRRRRARAASRRSASRSWMLSPAARQSACSASSM